MSQLQFELVLPCYNESKNLETIVRRAKDAAQNNGFTPETFQLVLVENGSKDNSASVMAELKKKTDFGSWFRVVTVPVNQGYGYGIFQGLQSTTAPFIAWSHADQQCDPSDAFKALKKATSAASPVLVKGVRVGRSGKEIFVSRVFDFMAWLILGFRIYEINAQPKVFPRQLLNVGTHPPKDFAFDIYMLYSAKKAGFTLEQIPVQFPPRLYGASNWAASFFSRYKTILGMIRYMWQLSRSRGRI